MNKSFCTIITQSHLPWALALNESLLQWDVDVELKVLVVDYEESSMALPDNLRLYSLLDLCSRYDQFDMVHRRYSLLPDEMRWTLKPIFLKYLIEEEHYTKIVYTDSDIHFYNNYDFLWDLLEDNNCLLTPHWLSIEPNSSLTDIQRVGLYNAGFFACNSAAVDILSWWAKACIYRCVSGIGEYNVDQGYLDIIPVYFNKVKVLQHKGCNVAYWNSDYLKRSFSNGVGYVSDSTQKFPIIFYHFARSRFDQFIAGSDMSLRPLLEILNSRLTKYKYGKDIVELGETQIGRKLPLKSSTLALIKSILPFEIRRKIKK